MSGNGIFTVHPRSPNFRLAAYSTAENVYKPIAIHLGSSTGELPKPNSDPLTISLVPVLVSVGAQLLRWRGLIGSRRAIVSRAPNPNGKPCRSPKSSRARRLSRCSLQ